MIEFALGETDLSIATDEAIKVLDIKAGQEYDILAINVLTLLRNLIDCTGKENQTMNNIGAFYKRLVRDMETISDFCEIALNLTVLYYVPRYDKLYQKAGFNILKNNLKEVKGERALVKEEISTTCVDRLLNPEATHGHKIHELDCFLDGLGKNLSVLAITHHPINLLKYGSFAKLDLLESHTGAIKRYPTWSSKLQIVSEDRSLIPFNSLTLQVFGDGITITGQKSAVKKKVLNLAFTSQWNGMTTRDRCRFSLDKSNDPELKPLTALLS